MAANVKVWRTTQHNEGSYRQGFLEKGVRYIAIGTPDSIKFFPLYGRVNTVDMFKEVRTYYNIVKKEVEDG